MLRRRMFKRVSGIRTRTLLVFFASASARPGHEGVVFTSERPSRGAALLVARAHKENDDARANSEHEQGQAGRASRKMSDQFLGFGSKQVQARTFQGPPSISFFKQASWDRIPSLTPLFKLLPKPPLLIKHPFEPSRILPAISEADCNRLRASLARPFRREKISAYIRGAHQRASSFVSPSSGLYSFSSSLLSPGMSYCSPALLVPTMASPNVHQPLPVCAHATQAQRGALTSPSRPRAPRRVPLPTQLPCACGRRGAYTNLFRRPPPHLHASTSIATHAPEKVDAAAASIVANANASGDRRAWRLCLRCTLTPYLAATANVSFFFRHVLQCVPHPSPLVPADLTSSALNDDSVFCSSISWYDIVVLYILADFVATVCIKNAIVHYFTSYPLSSKVINEPGRRWPAPRSGVKRSAAGRALGSDEGPAGGQSATAACSGKAGVRALPSGGSRRSSTARAARRPAAELPRRHGLRARIRRDQRDEHACGAWSCSRAPAATLQRAGNYDESQSHALAKEARQMDPSTEFRARGQGLDVPQLMRSPESCTFSSPSSVLSSSAPFRCPSPPVRQAAQALIAGDDAALTRAHRSVEYPCMCTRLIAVRFEHTNIRTWLRWMSHAPRRRTCGALAYVRRVESAQVLLEAGRAEPVIQPFGSPKSKRICMKLVAVRFRHSDYGIRTWLADVHMPHARWTSQAALPSARLARRARYWRFAGRRGGWNGDTHAGGRVCAHVGAHPPLILSSTDVPLSLKYPRPVVHQLSSLWFLSIGVPTTCRPPVVVHRPASAHDFGTWLRRIYVLRGQVEASKGLGVECIKSLGVEA
ncbi:hypothetical protein GGX14DRAFT_645531 [Mycena pura]|uniref:Uncharacterized protein n=1 Tax=Mycena pura TaxID=153505 RepID=A0AAD6VBK2_9AGAR|nr:hypothetical protein GGX14DRAFT_645531 [Mycena pura]